MNALKQILSQLGQKTDGKKTVATGLITILLGALVPQAREWAAADPEGFANAVSTTLTSVGGLVILFRKWRSIMTTGEEDRILEQYRKTGQSPFELEEYGD